MKRFGLIGYPLSHSFSKRFFSEKFENEKIADCVYDHFSIPSIEELPELLKRYPDLRGLNVTIPYKEKAVAYLDDASEVVKQIAACNCILIKNGKLTGFNTDVTGFKMSLQTKLKAHHQRALVLGKGGAAKAVAYVLKSLNIDFLFVVRANKNDSQTILYEDVNDAILRAHQLVINTTPLGTFPDLNSAPPIPYHLLSPCHFLYDLVYNPAETVFLKYGAEQGATILNGSDMLVIQAEESWKIWTQ